MLHNLLIDVHAICAVAAFGLGLAAILQPATRLSVVVRSYMAALWLMVLFLIAVVLVDWAGLNSSSQLVYSSLVLLALYTGWRGWRAARALQHHDGQWRDACVDDVGFTLITLFDGFVIVGSIDLGAPIWFVVAAGILGVLVGRLGTQRLKNRPAVPSPT